MKIKHILFEISSNCNFHCKYCYFSKSKNEIDANYAKKIIRILKNDYGLKSIGFTGGEPLMYDKLFSIIEYTKNLNLAIAIGTNGSLLNILSSNYIKKYINTVIISLDGEEKYYNNITGTHLYKKVINNLVKLKKEGVNFGTHITLTKNNFDDFDRIVKLHKHVGSSFIQVGIIQKTNNVNKNINKLLFSEKDYEKIFRTITRDYPIKIIFKDLIHPDQYKKNQKILPSSFQPFFAIDAKGDIYPMIDAPSTCKLTNNIAKYEIDIIHLIKYINTTKRCIIKGSKLLNSGQVINPYLIIQKELDAKN